MLSMKELILGIADCGCGKAHRCPIDAIDLAEGAVERLPDLCGDYAHILVVCDRNTLRVCGSVVAAVLEDKATLLVLEDNGDVVVPNEEKVAEIEAACTEETDLIIGVGSGVINDLCKYVSFFRNLPYFIVATAPSMDGYASVGAAMILRGMKATVNCRPPKAILADPRVLGSAPAEMLRSGYGDIIGKYSCLNDWLLAREIRGEYFCQHVYDIVMDCVKAVENLPEAILDREPQALQTLMEALVIVGIAMAYVGNSRPASGSEHHLSHYFEITGILRDRPYFLHGVDVAYSTYVTARLRETILKKTFESQPFDQKLWEAEICRIYGSSAGEVLALQEKLGWYHLEEREIIGKRDREIRTILAQCPSSEAIGSLLMRIGLPLDRFLAQYGEADVRDAVRWGKDLKDRYTVLWLYDRFCSKEEA